MAVFFSFRNLFKKNTWPLSFMVTFGNHTTSHKNPLQAVLTVLENSGADKLLHNKRLRERKEDIENALRLFREKSIYEENLKNANEALAKIHFLK